MKPPPPASPSCAGNRKDFCGGGLTADGMDGTPLAGADSRFEQACDSSDSAVLLALQGSQMNGQKHPEAPNSVCSTRPPKLASFGFVCKPDSLFSITYWLRSSFFIHFFLCGLRLVMAAKCAGRGAGVPSVIASLHNCFRLLHSAFRILPPAFCLLLSAYCLLPSDS
jgi:hypothetical protein